MTWLKAHWKALAVTLALLLAVVWYSRPVDIYTLAPGLKEPNTIDFTLWELGDGGAEYPLQSFSPEDPEWDAALEAVEALRFRRPPWNPILQFIPDHHTTGRVTHDGDHHVMFFLGKRPKGYVQVQFFIDEWSYNNPLPFSFANRALTLWVDNSKETGDALAEAIRPLLEEPEAS